jgi:hypothetical protein
MYLNNAHIGRIDSRVAAITRGLPIGDKGGILARNLAAGKASLTRWFFTNEQVFHKQHKQIIARIAMQFGTDTILHCTFSLPANVRANDCDSLLTRWNTIRRGFIAKLRSLGIVRGYVRVIGFSARGRLHVHLLLFTNQHMGNHSAIFYKLKQTGNFSALPPILADAARILRKRAIKAGFGRNIAIRTSEYSNPWQIASYLVKDMGRLVQNQAKDPESPESQRPKSLNHRRLIEYFPRKISQA